jgi:hypothetical protein
MPRPNCARVSCARIGAMSRPSVMLVLIGLVLLLPASCMSGSKSPFAPGVGGEDAAKAQAVEQAIAVISNAVGREDLNALRDAVSPLYTLDGNLALRFYTTTTTSDNPSATNDEAAFFNDFFAQNENISFSLTPTNVAVSGNVATAQVQFALSAVYILDVPPTTYQAESSDVMIFAVDDGRWKLTSWQVDPDAIPAEGAEEQAVLDQLTALTEALADKDLVAAAAVAAPGMYLDRAVQLRFQTMQTLGDSPNPPADFSDFFSTVFVENEQIAASFGVQSVIVLGSRAFVNATFSLSAVYTGTIPPEPYSAGGTDEMTFDRISGEWRISTWREKVTEQPGPTEALLRSRIAELVAAVNDEDASAVQSLESGLLTLDDSIALRFRTTGTLSDPPVFSDSLSTFLSGVFTQNENINLTLTVDSVQITGEVAMVQVDFMLSATYLLSDPPAYYISPASGAVTDTMVWVFDDGEWLLTSWRQKDVEEPPPPPTEEELLRTRIASLANAISVEDIATVQAIESGLLTLKEAFALRFQTTGTLSDPPVFDTSLSGFLNQVFAQNENISLVLTVNSVEIDGEVAEVKVSFALSATYLADGAPVSYASPEVGVFTDYMVWEFAGTNWKLVTWQLAD